MHPLLATCHVVVRTTSQRCCNGSVDMAVPLPRMQMQMGEHGCGSGIDLIIKWMNISLCLFCRNCNEMAEHGYGSGPPCAESSQILYAWAMDAPKLDLPQG